MSTYKEELIATTSNIVNDLDKQIKELKELRHEYYVLNYEYNKCEDDLDMRRVHDDYGVEKKISTRKLSKGNKGNKECVDTFKNYIKLYKYIKKNYKKRCNRGTTCKILNTKTNIVELFNDK